MVRSFAKLSRTQLRSLRPGEHCTERGITFERLANGDGLFSINVMVDGQRIHRSLGREFRRSDAPTAEEFIAKVRREAREGRLNLPKKRKLPFTLTADTPLYLERLRQEGGKEIERKDQRLQQWLIPFLGDIQIGQITSFDIKRYKKHRSGNQSKHAKN